MMKSSRWFEILLVSIVMAISLYAALSDPQNLSYRWFTRDDAYYYFKVAQNISEGHGSTFDGINPTNGYHPLWMLICVPIFALARFDLILPLRVLLVVLGGLSAATAILFFRLIGKIFTPAIGAIAALYWAFSYDVLTRVYQQGLETGIAIFFVLLLVYKLYEFEITWRNNPVSNKQLLTLGLIGLLTVFSRLDLIFLAGMMGIWIIFRNSPLRYFLPLDIAAIFVSILLAFVIRLSFPEYYRFSDAAITMVAVSLIVKLLCAYFLGLYQPAVLGRTSKLVSRLAIFLLSSSGITAVIMLALARLAHFEGFPRIAIAYDLIITALFFSLSRFGEMGLSTNPFPDTAQTTPIEQLSQNWKKWAVEGMAYYGTLGGGLALYMLMNKVLFGTFSPVSGQIKRWWGSLAGNVYGGSVANTFSFLGISNNGDSNIWYPLSTLINSWAKNLGLRYIVMLVIFALLYYLLLFINKQKAKNSMVQLSMVPLFASAWLQVLYYHAPGYAAYKEWYWVGQLILVILTASQIFGLFYQTRNVRYAETGLWAIALTFGFILLVPFWNNIRSNMTYNEWQPSDPYNDLAAFIEANTEPGSIIGFTGGGNAGYFIHDRTVINMDGLINSYQYFQLLKDKKAGEYLANEGMDYILANSKLLEQLPYKGQFAPYIEPMNVIYGGKDLVRYHAP
jgi:hypothetical protein